MLTAGTRVHPDTTVASEQLLQPRDATDKTPLIAATVEIPAPTVFQELQQEAVTSHLGAMQHEHHTRALFWRQGSKLLSREHQQDVPVNHFAVQEVKRANLLPAVATRSSLHPYLTECRAKSHSEQGD